MWQRLQHGEVINGPRESDLCSTRLQSRGQKLQRPKCTDRELECAIHSRGQRKALELRGLLGHDLAELHKNTMRYADFLHLDAQHICSPPVPNSQSPISITVQT